jgi:acetyl esterase/lipase
VGPDFAVEEVDAGGVPALRLPKGSAAGGPTVVYFHGGGYVIGDVRGYADIATRISAGAAETFSVAYRLAPEDTFPTALDDAERAYRAIVAERDPGSVIVAGDSAGGGLALALILRLQETSGPLPAGVVVLSPWADLSLTSESLERNAEADPVLSREALQAWSEAYLAGASPTDPLASPVFGDYSGWPPMLIFTGSADVLEDDARRVAEAARKAGVDVDLTAVDGMVHSWMLFPFLSDSKAASAKIEKFIEANAS